MPAHRFRRSISPLSRLGSGLGRALSHGAFSAACAQDHCTQLLGTLIDHMLLSSRLDVVRRNIYNALRCHAYRA